MLMRAKRCAEISPFRAECRSRGGLQSDLDSGGPIVQCTACAEVGEEQQLVANLQPSWSPRPCTRSRRCFAKGASCFLPITILRLGQCCTLARPHAETELWLMCRRPGAGPRRHCPPDALAAATRCRFTEPPVGAPASSGSSVGDWQGGSAPVR